MTGTFHRGRLRTFIIEEDRGLNPVFAGRRDIRQIIMDKCELITERHLDKTSARSSAGGMTQLIQGPPGIGKTSLLEKIREDCILRMQSNPLGHKVIPIGPLVPDDLGGSQVGIRIQRSINNLLQRVGLRKAGRLMGDIAQIFMSLGVHGFSVGIDLKREIRLNVPTDLTILLLIDEVQTLDLIDSSEPAALLRRLHVGSDRYPILPVLAGLSNSTNVIETTGISRLGDGAIHRLPPLNDQEVQASMHLFATHFGIQGDPDLVERWRQIIGNWCDGWPKHLQNSMKSLSEELLLHEGDLGRIDVSRVQRKSVMQRTNYYMTRFGSFYTDPDMIGMIMAQIGLQPQRAADIRAAIQKTATDPRWANLPHPDFNDLLRYGLIDLNLTTRWHGYVCPIPSLHSFAVAQTGNDLHPCAYEGAMDEISDCLNEGQDVNACDAWDRTPLHLAAAGNWPDVVRALLDAGADPEHHDHQGRQPLDTVPDGSVIRSHLAERASE